MEAKELMIGNLVIHNDEIVEFDSHKAWHITELEGIPLTDKELVNLGFICIWSGQGDGSTYQNKDLNIILHSHDFTKNFYFTREYSRSGNTKWDHLAHIETKLPFVHNLQNLCFVLTGKELTLKTEGNEQE